MHLKRWITSLIALPFLIWLIYQGGFAFAALISVVCIASLCEYYRLVFNPEGKTISGVILLTGIGFGTAMVLAAYFQAVDMILLLLIFNLILVGLFSLSQFKSDNVVLDNMQKQLQSMTYIPLSLSLLVLLRQGDAGMGWVFMVIFIIFAGDIGAYYIGSYWGRHKLCPSVSPGKTVEGALGGLCANIVLGIVFKLTVLSSFSWSLSFLMFLAMGISGQIGDLFESELKRKSEIKDSSGILPGHGGILDRIDAVLFAVPVAYLFKTYILIG